MKRGLPCVCECDAVCVRACVNFFSHILSEFSTPCSCVHVHTWVHLFVGHARVCAFQGVEEPVQPPDGGYRFCLAPSLINFFSDWLWLLINKTWSRDQMQISSRGVEGDCWLLFQICLFRAPLPSTLDWRAEKGQNSFVLQHMLAQDALWSYLICVCYTYIN